MLKPGIYGSKDLSSEAYHADTDSVSRSGLMRFKECEAKYLHKDDKETAAKNIGSAFHTLILEPELFDRQYVVKPARVYLKDSGREAYAAYQDLVASLEHTEKTILSQDDMDRLLFMRESFYSQTEIKELIQGGIYERSYVWQERDSGMIVKARPDIIHPNMYVDIKTCSDASPRAFEYEMRKYGYHIQGAMVRDARNALESIDCPNVVNIAIETKEPYVTAIYVYDELLIEEGDAIYRDTLKRLKIAKQDNHYQHYGTHFLTMRKWD